jgi:hypothetical protein
MVSPSSHHAPVIEVVGTRDEDTQETATQPLNYNATTKSLGSLGLPDQPCWIQEIAACIAKVSLTAIAVHLQTLAHC